MASEILSSMFSVESHFYLWTEPGYCNCSFFVCVCAFLRWPCASKILFIFSNISSFRSQDSSISLKTKSKVGETGYEIPSCLFDVSFYPIFICHYHFNLAPDSPFICYFQKLPNKMTRLLFFRWRCGFQNIGLLSPCYQSGQRCHVCFVCCGVPHYRRQWNRIYTF